MNQSPPYFPNFGQNSASMASILSSKLLPFPSPHCTLRNKKPTTKHSDRLLSSLATSSSAAATAHIIRKFVASSKSASLQTLSLLLFQSSPLALPIYRRIAATRWFKWTPKLAAKLISLLESNGSSSEALELISESVSNLASKRDIAHFYCDLIDAGSDRKLRDFVLECYGLIGEMEFVGRRPFESMVRGLSFMGMVEDAEKVLDEMGHSGFRPSLFEYRMVIQGYGLLGSFDEMIRVVGKMEDAGLGVDTVCANVVLSCYGDYGRLPEMADWIRKMRVLGIGYSVRTYNSVLNSCPGIVSMVKDLGTLSLSVNDLLKELKDDEALLVWELVSSSVLVENLKWSHAEGELDLHGFHLASAYVIILQWMEELRSRFSVEDEFVVPVKLSVVCGLGKHSIVRGESPVKKLVSELMFRLKSPMKIDRKNVGRFVANGKAVRDWLCC